MKKDMDKQFLVLGLGRFGQSVLRTLIESGIEAMGCDIDPVLVHDAASYATHVVQADVTSEADLLDLGIGNFEVVIVAIGGDFEAALMATMIAKERGAKYVLVKAQGFRQQKILKSIGADLVVMPEIEMGKRVAINLISNNILEYINVSDDYSIVEIRPLEDWDGKTLLETDLRGKYHLNVIAARNGDRIEVSPSSNYVISSSDILVVVGNTSDLAKFK